MKPPASKPTKDIDAIFAEGKAIDAAARRAVRQALAAEKPARKSRRSPRPR